MTSLLERLGVAQLRIQISRHAGCILDNSFDVGRMRLFYQAGQLNVPAGARPVYKYNC
jgi:hypothetical protein